MPTIASLTKSRYINSTFGFDITADNLDKQPQYRLSMSFNGQETYLHLIGKDKMLKINADGTNSQLIDIKSDNRVEDIQKEYPELTKELKPLTLGLYESINYTRYFNSQDDVEKKIELKK
jgi:hypothetical protein